MDKSGLSSNGMENGIQRIKIKSEPVEDTIKNYAEHTMNELLGLFGYDDKINSADTENLNFENYSENKNVGTAALHNNHVKEKDRSAARLKSGLIKQRKEAGTSSDRECLPEQCAWCKKPGNKQISLETTTGTKVFCSEICFTQCRRASFKRKKNCDWCKHAHQTINIVEFQNGDTVLQFCSEKCLNQYKMRVFCKETQEHLQNMIASGDDSLSGKEDERDTEILITPELWIKGEKNRLAAEVRDVARDRYNRERKQCRDRYQKARGLSLDRNSNLKSVQSKLETEDIAGVSMLDKLGHDQNLKSKNVQSLKESINTSPVRLERDTKTPDCPAMPFQFLHSAMATMGPWLQQAQYMGSSSPGIAPYGPIPPMMLAGLFPHLYSGKIGETKTLVLDRENDTVKNKTLKEDKQSISSCAPDPECDHAHLSQVHDSGPSSTLADRRTSSLFPVDFPQFFPAQEMKNSQNQSTATGTTMPHPGLSGVPPITMMLPFPVILPLPVPVPIPIPLTLQQLKSLFGYTDENNYNPSKTKSQFDKPKESKSPLLLGTQSPRTVTPFSNDFYNELSEIRSGSQNSCPDLTHSSNIHYTYNDRLSKNKESFNYKRSRTPETITSVDMIRSSKYTRYDLSSTTPDSSNGVIDLSASRENGQKSDDNMSENGGIDDQVKDDNNSSRDNTDNCSEDLPTLPKIHIITHKDETPLNEPRPLPPTEHPYSSRRGLILDAPAIPKVSKSPSPERRIYVRNVPRDIIEAAKRRCLRARIRTK